MNAVHRGKHLDDADGQETAETKNLKDNAHADFLDGGGFSGGQATFRSAPSDACDASTAATALRRNSSGSSMLLIGVRTPPVPVIVSVPYPMRRPKMPCETWKLSTLL